MNGSIGNPGSNTYRIALDQLRAALVAARAGGLPSARLEALESLVGAIVVRRGEGQTSLVPLGKPSGMVPRGAYEREDAAHPEA